MRDDEGKGHACAITPDHAEVRRSKEALSVSRYFCARKCSDVLP